MRRLGEAARSLAFYAAFYVGSIFVVTNAAAMLLSRSDPRFRRAVGLWARYHRWCVTRLLGMTVAIEGPTPPPGTLIALKHESFFEAIDLPLLLDNPVVFAKAQLMRIPLWGLAGERYGLVAVERDAGASALRKMIAAAKRLGAGGRLIAIFPEGTRVPHGDRPPLQAGFAGLYKLLGREVVPVAVCSGPFYHRWIKRRGTIRIRFGEPIPAGLSREEIEVRVRDAINLLNV